MCVKQLGIDTRTKPSNPTYSRKTLLMADQLPIQLHSLLAERVIALRFEARANDLLHDDPKRSRWLNLARQGLRDSTRRLTTFRDRWPDYRLEVNRLLRFQL